MNGHIGAPAPRPCASCPYAEDVPSGIWASTEYDKLIAYDAPTGQQPTGVFLCHQTDRDSAARRMCAGWVACHGAEDLLALRLAVMHGWVTVETYDAAVNYRSLVKVFDSGRAAAHHGCSEIEYPDVRARLAIGKIVRRRGDLEEDSRA